MAISSPDTTRTDGVADFGAYGEFTADPLATIGVLGDALPTTAHGELDEPVFSVLGVGRAALDDGRAEDGRVEVGLAYDARRGLDELTGALFFALRPRLGTSD